MLVIETDLRSQADFTARCAVRQIKPDRLGRGPEIHHAGRRVVGDVPGGEHFWGNHGVVLGRSLAGKRRAGEGKTGVGIHDPGGARLLFKHPDRR